MNRYTIQKSSENEADALAKIGADTFYETFILHNTEEDIQAYIKKAYLPQSIKHFINQNLGAYYMAYEQNLPVGYIKIIHGQNQRHSAELEKIYVYHTHQGKGVADALMKQAIIYATNLGAKELFLGVWQENKRACAFYQKFGFEIYDTRQFMLGSRICQDFMMKLKLA